MLEVEVSELGRRSYSFIYAKLRRQQVVDTGYEFVCYIVAAMPLFMQFRRGRELYHMCLFWKWWEEFIIAVAMSHVFNRVSDC